MAIKKNYSTEEEISVLEDGKQLQIDYSDLKVEGRTLETTAILEELDFTFKHKGYTIVDKLKDGFKTDIKAISFFSGAGGLDIGSCLAGVEVISSMDFDADCVKTLSANPLFENAHISHSDISNIKGNDYKNLLKKVKPKKLILIGGPPCQPFSKAGYWVGNNSRLGINDPRNMIGEYLRIVEELQPDGFLLENVESLLHPTNRVAVDFIIERINQLGYHYTLVRANAIDYGVPQKRKRVFFVASKKAFRTTEPVKTHGSDEERLLNPNLLPYERVVDWIGKFDTPDFFERQETTDNGTYHEELGQVPPGKNYIALTAAAGYPDPKFIAQKRFWSFLLKLHPERPSWTVAAQPGPWVGPFHWKSRRLRVPEVAAIQTFPEDYVFVGSRRSIQKQIGNAVPPLLGKAMVEFLISNI
ncbi:DNA cytosine methyltransferase [Pontibacter roseus]|uniref:DNA cytosine methyltransferase n=1 Tax=Pontibacter roseus TaxID=336989 RepID=UPI00037F4CDC|nr:DNA cytosine methyltransferase [Pontibacter roseus]